MAREIMERKASDNKYLHRDFHNLMNMGIEYLREKFGEGPVREYLRQFASAYYAPLKASLKENGLAAVLEYYKKIYTAEEAIENVEFALSNDELVIRVKQCPAVEHIRKSNIPVSPLYHELTKTVNETVCEGTPFVFELLKYDHETGASVQRFYKKGGKTN